MRAQDGLRIADRLRAHGARYWYVGGGFGLIWQSALVVAVILDPGPVAAKVVALVLLAGFYAAFMLLGPILMPEPVRTKLVVIAVYWAASTVLFPLVGTVAIWLWLVVVSMLAFTGLPARIAILGAAAVISVQFGAAALGGFVNGTIFAAPVTGVTAITLIGIGALSASNGNLRIARDEIARLAVVEERARFARDLHDVLGHSLTVVAVKSDLARKLVKRDPDRAEAEIADIEHLARGALADLRHAVADYRELSLETELAAASTALAAAGIEAHLPADASALDPALRTVFAWVLREGVTNVIRHSRATACWVTVEPNRLTVADDGRGPVAQRGDGNGLRGLRERADLAGAELVVGRSERGGFELTARRAA